MGWNRPNPLMQKVDFFWLKVVLVRIGVLVSRWVAMALCFATSHELRPVIRIHFSASAKDVAADE
jgi:hypothetical protein